MLKDLLDQELKVGDRIAYARQGSGSSHGELVIGRIVKLGTRPDHPEVTCEWEYHGDPRFERWAHKKSTVYRIENMVKI